MKLCIAGKNNIAVDCLYFALEFIDRKEICVTLNKNDSYKNTWQKSLGFVSKIENIEIKTLTEVQSIKDVVFLSLEFDRIIKPELFNSKRLYNIHFSFLPEYKGMYTSLLPILHGEKYSGVTLHQINSGIDTGDIIEQIRFDIDKMTCSDLYFKYLEKGTELVCKNIPNLLSGKAKTIQQPANKSTYYSKASFNLKQIEINTNQTAFQIQQFLIDFTFRVYQLPVFHDFEIYKTRITKNRSTDKPGTIINDNAEKYEIATIDYNILLYKDYFNEMIACCKSNDLFKASQIISFIPNIDEFESNGWNPLIIACFYGADKIVKLLIENGANINLTNLNGTTTLMYAKEGFLKNKDFTITKLLIERGIDIKAKDIYGKDIFDYTKNIELSDLLNNYYDKIS